MAATDLLSIALAGFGLAVLVLVAVIAHRDVRRFMLVRNAVLASVTERGGLLRARSAALRVALDERLGRRRRYHRSGTS